MKAEPVIWHKKRGRALGPASVVCSQFGKLTKLLLGSAKGGCLIRIKRQRAFRINVCPRTINSRRSLQRSLKGNRHSTVSVANNTDTWRRRHFSSYTQQLNLSNLHTICSIRVNNCREDQLIGVVCCIISKRYLLTLKSSTK